MARPANAHINCHRPLLPAIPAVRRAGALIPLGYRDSRTDHTPARCSSLGVADVWVPASATLETDTASPEGERWELDGTSYQDAVAQEAALIPVGQPLNGHPYCQKTAIPPGSTDNTSWIWGRPREALIVSVLPVLDNFSAIVIRHTTEASLFCK